MYRYTKGLRQEIQKQLRIDPPKTVDEAIRKAKNIEAAFSMGQGLAEYSLKPTKETQIYREILDIKDLIQERDQQECQLCWQKGHVAEDCPKRTMNTVAQSNYYSNPDRRNQLDKPLCYGCNRTGHIRRNCPNVCQNCGQSGHKAPECNKRNDNQNYQPRILQRSNNSGNQQNQNYQNYQNNRQQNNRNNNNYNRNSSYNNNNNNQNRPSQPRPQKSFIAKQEEHIDQTTALASQMAELTNVLKNLKA